MAINGTNKGIIMARNGNDNGHNGNENGQDGNKNGNLWQLEWQQEWPEWQC